MTALSQESQESQNRRAAGTSSDELARAELEAEAHATERVITFSDAVIAIAITLLALDLPVPGGSLIKGLTNGQLLHDLWANRPDYLAFLVSFLVIGLQWSSHRRVTRYLCGLNGLVSKLNVTWLLMMVLTPFAARLLSGSGAFGVRFTIYTLIQIIATACLMVMNRAAVRGNLVRGDAPEWARHPDNVPYLALCITFLLSIPVAFATSGAYVLWAASPLVTRGLRRIMAQGRHVTSDDRPGSGGGWPGPRPAR